MRCVYPQRQPKIRENEQMKARSETHYTNEEGEGQLFFPKLFLRPVRRTVKKARVYAHSTEIPGEKIRENVSKHKGGKKETKVYILHNGQQSDRAYV